MEKIQVNIIFFFSSVRVMSHLTGTQTDHLPTDVSRFILALYLSRDDIMTCCLVSRRWATIFRPLVWAREWFCFSLVRKGGTLNVQSAARRMTMPDFKFQNVCCLDYDIVAEMQGQISPSVQHIQVNMSSSGTVPDVKFLQYVGLSTLNLGLQPRKLEQLVIDGESLHCVAQQTVALHELCPRLCRLGINDTYDHATVRRRSVLKWSMHGFVRLTGMPEGLLFFGTHMTHLRVPPCPITRLDLARMPHLVALSCALDECMTDADASGLAWPLGLEKLCLNPVIPDTTLSYETYVQSRCVTANLVTPRYRQMTSLREIILNVRYLGNVVDLCLDSVTTLQSRCQYESIQIHPSVMGNAHAIPEWRFLGLLDFTERTPARLETLCLEGSVEVRGKMPRTLRHLFVNYAINRAPGKIYTVSGLAGSIPDSLVTLNLSMAGYDLAWVNATLSHPSMRLPKVEQLRLPSNFNGPFAHVIASMVSCELLSIRGTFNQPIADEIPCMTRLRHLDIGGCFNQDVMGRLPEGLRFLDVSDSRIPLPVDPDARLPSSLEDISFPLHCQGNLSPLIRETTFSNLRVLRLPGTFSGPLNLGGSTLPETLEELWVGNSYAYCLASIVPPSLKRISLGFSYTAYLLPLFSKLPILESFDISRGHPRQEDWTEWPVHAFAPTLQHLRIPNTCHIFIPWQRWPRLKTVYGPSWMADMWRATVNAKKTMDTTRDAKRCKV